MLKLPSVNQVLSVTSLLKHNWKILGKLWRATWNQPAGHMRPAARTAGWTALPYINHRSTLYLLGSSITSQNLLSIIPSTAQICIIRPRWGCTPEVVLYKSL